jgi:hypothetical protein
MLLTDSAKAAAVGAILLYLGMLIFYRRIDSKT